MYFLVSVNSTLVIGHYLLIALRTFISTFVLHFSAQCLFDIDGFCTPNYLYNFLPITPHCSRIIKHIESFSISYFYHINIQVRHVDNKTKEHENLNKKGEQIKKAPKILACVYACYILIQTKRKHFPNVIVHNNRKNTCIVHIFFFYCKIFWFSCFH